MIGLLKDKSQYYTEKYIFFYLEMVVSTQEFFPFTQELIRFTQTNKYGRGTERHLPKTDESVVQPAGERR